MPGALAHGPGSKSTRLIDRMSPQRTMDEVTLAKIERQPATTLTPPTLQLSCNGSIVQELPLDAPRFLIGRSEKNDMSIPSDYVSSYHILLLCHEGSTILVDLNSTNGTFVNSELVHNHVLVDDDVITVDLHSMFVQYSIKYTDPFKTARGKLGDIEYVDRIVAEALKDAGDLLKRDGTDRLPALSENMPTEIGLLDDR